MMIGIDHNEASIDKRERFSFTKNQAQQALAKLRNQKTVSGCLLLSTCKSNRVMDQRQQEDEHEELMESISEESSPIWWKEGEDAVNHLFRLSCGLESQLTGEDQILTQVRDALTLAQSCGCGDRVLGQDFSWSYFRRKESKNSGDCPQSACRRRKAVWLYGRSAGKPEAIYSCLIIGNGQIGRLLAEDLSSSESRCNHDLRNESTGKKYRESILSRRMPYDPHEERMENLGKYHAVIRYSQPPLYREG